MENLLIISGLLGIILFAYSILIFIIARLCKDNSVMDIAYGPAFLVSAAGVAYISDITTLVPSIIIGCIAAWSIRLSSRIFRKNFGKPEDPRYAAWRKEWLERGRLYFLVRSYLQINLLQVFIILLVLTPAAVAFASPHIFDPRFLLAGFIVFVFGLTYETIADLQLDAFLTRKRAGTETATLMTTGLFHWSRRPNYFGESLVWTGLAIMVLPLPLGYIAVVSPLLITYIVTRVTGPMLETYFLERYPDEYRAYMDRTSYFIPWFPKK